MKPGIKKAIVQILLIVLILILATISCIGGGGGDGGSSSQSSSQTTGSGEILSVNATATYGAEQFHIQLTAMAGGNP